MLHILGILSIAINMCEADTHMLVQFILLTLLKVGRVALAA